MGPIRGKLVVSTTESVNKKINVQSRHSGRSTLGFPSILSEQDRKLKEKLSDRRDGGSSRV